MTTFGQTVEARCQELELMNSGIGFTVDRLCDGKKPTAFKAVLQPFLDDLDRMSDWPGGDADRCGDTARVIRSLLS